MAFCSRAFLLGICALARFLPSLVPDAQAQTFPMVINIDAQVYGNAPGIPTLEVSLAPGSYRLTLINPELHASAQYYAWSNVGGSGIWRTQYAFEICDFATGPSVGINCCWSNPQEAFDLAMNKTYEFSLPVMAVAGFYVGDNIVQDNQGGISLLLEVLEGGCSGSCDELCQSVPAESSTWGRIKALYERDADAR